MYPLSLFVAKMGRHRRGKLLRIPDIPAGPPSPIRASPCRHAAPGAPRRVAWRRTGRNGAGPRGMLCAAAMALSALACESTSPEVDDTALVTDGTSFRLDTARWRGHLVYRTEIPYKFTNRTGSRVYIPNCLGRFWDRSANGGGW